VKENFIGFNVHSAVIKTIQEEVDDEQFEEFVINICFCIETTTNNYF
jgi:hypothetical protein